MIGFLFKFRAFPGEIGAKGYLVDCIRTLMLFSLQFTFAQNIWAMCAGQE